MECAYCLRDAAMTREHVLPAWVGASFEPDSSVSPAAGNHRFGGALVVTDVCASCNNGVLSQLDEHAKTHWDAGARSHEFADVDDLVLFGRWAVKVAYNAQRACTRNGTAGEEPPMPRVIPEWILEGGRMPSALELVLARLPSEHQDAECVGIYGSNGTPLPRRVVHLGSIVAAILWDHPAHPGIARELANLERNRLPGLRLSTDSDSAAIPLLCDPDMVSRGFWNNTELVTAFARRLATRTEVAAETSEEASGD